MIASVTAIGAYGLLGEALTWSLGLAWATGLGSGVAVGLVVARSRRSADQARPEVPATAHALAASGDGFWDLDVRRGKVHYNDRCATMLGYDPSEVEDALSFWGGLVHPDDLPAARHALDAHMEGETDVYEISVRLRDKAGGWQWVLDRGHVVERDDAGQAIRVVGVHRLLAAPPDETPQRLLRSIADELQAVLAVFLGRRELAAWTTDETAQAFADTAFDDGVESALHLVEALSTYGSDQPAKVRPTKLAAAVADVADELEMDVDIEGDAAVAADPSLLRIALRALLAAMGPDGSGEAPSATIRTQDDRALLRARASADADPRRRWRWIVARVIAERHGGWGTTHGDAQAPDELELALPLCEAGRAGEG